MSICPKVLHSGSNQVHSCHCCRHHRQRRSCPRLNRQRSGIAVPLPSLMASLSLSSSLLSSLSTPLAPLMLLLMSATLLTRSHSSGALSARPSTTSTPRHLRTSNRQQSTKSDSELRGWAATAAMAMVTAAVRTTKMRMMAAMAMAVPLTFTMTLTTTVTTQASSSQQ